ncbi:hypothetical protein H6P81_017140 [Aristolochia fimbriata]|uniref:Uncharacterized protein n=1 Tax=Aristolochia fimbriata TaxID=158543 RepID=A0AAV7E0D7_ARIFI|nr:hypothetical protein H6P81_017140 [Aristolochia fimbriata]
MPWPSDSLSPKLSYSVGIRRHPLPPLISRLLGWKSIYSIPKHLRSRVTYCLGFEEIGERLSVPFLLKSMGEQAPSKAYPQLVKLDKALKLAESWVNNMTGSTTDELNEVEFESRPARLGLGAKFVPQSKVASSLDPVGKKLLAKFSANKKRSANNQEESNPVEGRDGDSEEDELESRAKSFTKKRAMPPPTSLRVLAALPACFCESSHLSYILALMDVKSST